MSNRGHQRNPRHHAAGGKARYETPRRYETQGWTPMPWRSTNDACRTHAALSSPLTAPVQGSDLTARRGHTGRLTSGQGGHGHQLLRLTLEMKQSIVR